MIHLITACTENYTRSAQHLMASGFKHGFTYEGSHCADLENLPDTFMGMIGDNVKEKERCMFYIWKPFIIWDYIQDCKDGEIVCYADAGQTIVNSVKPLIDQIDQDIMMFNNPWKHVEWCKMDVLAEILPDNDDEGFNDYPTIITSRNCGKQNHKQVQASLIFFRITPEVRNFVKEWMLWCLMPGFCDNSPSKIRNYPTFQEHRYDQAVLTCLQIKYGYKLHPFPSIENMDAAYRITDHHRKSNEKW